MTGPVTLHAEATAELEAAALWYDEQRDGLGLQFLAAVDRTIQHSVTWPHAGAPVEGLPAEILVRHAPVPRFPYHVAYLATDVRDLHPRRRPSSPTARLLEESYCSRPDANPVVRTKDRTGHAVGRHLAISQAAGAERQMDR